MNAYTRRVGLHLLRAGMPGEFERWAQQQLARRDRVQGVGEMIRLVHEGDRASAETLFEHVWPEAELPNITLRAHLFACIATLLWALLLWWMR